MSRLGGRFIGDIVDLDTVSKARLRDTVTIHTPSVFKRCDRPGSGLTRQQWCEAVIAALPQALQITWPEFASQAGLAPRVQPNPIGAATYFPSIEVFGSEPKPIEITLAVSVAAHPNGDWNGDEPVLSHVALALAIVAPNARRFDPAAVFFAIERDLALRLR
jgi:hypothetical protein